MSIKAVTFDCAGTLVQANWNPARHIETIAERLNLDVPPGAGDVYAAMFASRRAAYEAANLKGYGAYRSFWLDLEEDWLAQYGLDPALAPAVDLEAMGLLFGLDQQVFIPYSDVEDALLRLKSDGYRLGLISNWDRSLHSLVDMFAWRSLFHVIVPSLEFGAEKPDPRIFAHALNELEVAADEALHIGDDPIDDLQGARAAGMAAVLIDRSRADSAPPYLHSLDSIGTALEWNG